MPSPGQSSSSSSEREGADEATRDGLSGELIDGFGSGRKRDAKKGRITYPSSQRSMNQTDSQVFAVPTNAQDLPPSSHDIASSNLDVYLPRTGSPMYAYLHAWPLATASATAPPPMQSTLHQAGEITSIAGRNWYMLTPTSTLQQQIPGGGFELALGDHNANLTFGVGATDIPSFPMLSDSQLGTAFELHRRTLSNPVHVPHTQHANLGGLLQQQVQFEQQRHLASLFSVSSLPETTLPRSNTNFAGLQRLDAYGSELGFLAISSEDALTASSRREQALPCRDTLTEEVNGRGHVEGKPKRPLSAYNLFFKDERAKLLSGLAPKEGEQTAGSARFELKKPSATSNPRIQIGFAEMAKTISARWRNIDPETQAKYQALAAIEMARYKEEKEAFRRSQQVDIEQSRARMESTVDEDTRREYLARFGSKKSGSGSKKRQRKGSR